MNLPEEIEILDRQYWIDKISGKFDMSDLEKKKKKPKKDLSIREKLKFVKTINILEFAPETIKNDKELILLALDRKKMSFHDVDKSLLNDKEFVLQYVEQSTYPSFFPLPISIKEDKEVFLAYYKKTPTCFHDIRWESKKFYNRETIKELLQINSAIVEELSNTYKDDLELAKIVIEQNPHNIRFLNKRTTEKICVDKAYCTELLQKNRDAFEYISMKLRGDKEFVLPYLKRNPSLIEKLSKKLRGDKEFIEQFIECYEFIDAVTDDLRCDEELMLKAVAHNPMCFYKIDKSLRNIDFYTKAIELNPKIYSTLWDDLQKEPNLIVSLLNCEFYYDHKGEKADPMELMNIVVLSQCRYEYNDLPNKNNLNFRSFVRNKFLNEALNSSLNKENEANSQLKKLKI
jgi:tetratricopeptide (TPR) repeat protein